MVPSAPDPVAFLHVFGPSQLTIQHLCALRSLESFQMRAGMANLSSLDKLCRSSDRVSPSDGL